ncbi:hypothetical protein Tco_1518985, partial [Tanacetum coccineum]
FERPRAPLLQILWGVINRAYIDYVERMWEEFTQSIHTFTKDKNNLAQHTQGKKKATLIVTPGVRFTKMIIFYLQSKNKFHLRPDSSLHLPTEEPVLGYLKFSDKGTKQEVFGMPIPNDLITDDIRDGSDPDSLASKPDKAAKPKATKKPKPAPAKPQEKKCKLVTKTFEAPSPAKRSKAGKVTKKRKPKIPLQLVDEFVDEGVPDKEPVYGDEEADTQWAIEASLKEIHGARQGPLPPVVIREPDSRKYQPLPEVQGKGKEKVSEEQVALDLLTLQTPKKKSPTEQYIFQRRTPAPTEPSGHADSPSLYAELGLSDSDSEPDEEVPPVVKSGAQDEGQVGPNPGIQDEGQAGPNPGIQDEGQVGPNPGIQDEGQAGPNPGDNAEPQPQSTLVVHAGPNHKHMDVEATNASIRPHPEQMDEYPQVQENLKLTVEEQVIPEEPASSTGTLSSLQHLAKDFSFGDQFFNDKPSEANNEKTNADTEAE